MSEIYAVFDVFERKPDEEATLAKLLEAIKDFEGRGSNSLRDFLRFAEGREGSSAWDIDVPEGADSVRAMTIHKAKGLGFPVVIALLYGERNRGFSHTVLREDGQLKLVKLTRQLSRGDDELRALYDGELLRDKVNKLNGLYVALTRAREEMYVIGVKGERDSFPFDLLPEPGLRTARRDRRPAPGAAHASAGASFPRRAARPSRRRGQAPQPRRTRTRRAGARGAFPNHVRLRRGGSADPPGPGTGRARNAR